MSKDKDGERFKDRFCSWEMLLTFVVGLCLGICADSNWQTITIGLIYFPTIWFIQGAKKIINQKQG